MKNYFDYGAIKRNLKDPKVRIVFVFLTVLLVLWIFGLFRTPSYYRPVIPISDSNMSQYLTNYILPELNNKSQYGRPFNLVISQEGINDIIARFIDADSLRQANLSGISIAFRKDRILLTGKAAYYGVDFFITLVLKPYIDRAGFLILKESVETGTSPVPYAGETAKKKILEKLAGFLNNINVDDFNKASFDNRRIEPIFSINHQRQRIEKITVEDGKLTIYFLPQQGR
jgi:hypothetical protein